MSVRFIHTADWHLGKPIAGVQDPQKRTVLQYERLAAIGRIADIARQQNAEFVLVAGDFFDTPTATSATVSAACSAIGSIGRAVYVIPGNHDHGGPGCLWEQEFSCESDNSWLPTCTCYWPPSPSKRSMPFCFRAHCCTAMKRLIPLCGCEHYRMI